MRIAFAEIAQETDSFSPMVTDLSDFETYGLYFGDDLLARMTGKTKPAAAGEANR